MRKIEAVFCGLDGLGEAHVAHDDLMSHLSSKVSIHIEGLMVQACKWTVSAMRSQ